MSNPIMLGNTITPSNLLGSSDYLRAGSSSSGALRLKVPIGNGQNA